MKPQILTIALDDQHCEITQRLEGGATMSSSWKRQTKGPGAETEEEFLERMAQVIHERTKERNAWRCVNCDSEEPHHQPGCPWLDNNEVASPQAEEAQAIGAQARLSPDTHQYFPTEDTPLTEEEMVQAASVQAREGQADSIQAIMAEIAAHNALHPTHGRNCSCHDKWSHRLKHLVAKHATCDKDIQSFALLCHYFNQNSPSLAWKSTVPAAPGEEDS